MRVEYEEKAHATDVFAERDRSVVLDNPVKPRGDVERAYRRLLGWLSAALDAADAASGGQRA